MSVLNTMLRDLERRGERLPLALTPQSPPQQETKAQAAAALPPRASAFEPAKRRPPLRPAVLLAAVAGAAAATWLWLHPARPKAETPRSESANAPATAPMQSTQPNQVTAPAVASPSTPPEALSPSTQPAASATSTPAQTPAQTSAPADPAATPAAAPVQPEHPHTRTPTLAAAAPEQPSSALRASEGGAQTPDATDGKSAAVQSVGPSELARAMQLITRGRNAEAAEALTAALSQRPAWNEARSTLAALQAEAGDRPSALLTLLDGVPFEPRRFAPMAAQLQAELNDPSGALQTLDRVPAEARDRTYHGLTAAVAQRAGRHDLAVAEYEAALRFAPADSVAWLGMGVSLQALGRDAEALAAYRSAAAGTLSDDLRNFTQTRISALLVSVPAAPAGR